MLDVLFSFTQIIACTPPYFHIDWVHKPQLQLRISAGYSVQYQSPLNGPQDFLRPCFLGTEVLDGELLLTFPLLLLPAQEHICIIFWSLCTSLSHPDILGANHGLKFAGFKLSRDVLLTNSPALHHRTDLLTNQFTKSFLLNVLFLVPDASIFF